MPRLGAHLSIAGGLPRAVDRAEASGCEALQIFTKSAGQWRARTLPAEEVALFRRRLRETKVDRHEHIGHGCLGLEPFRRIVNGPRFAKLPMLLETPKVDTAQSRKASDVDPLDRKNLATLRGLRQSPKTSAPKR